LLKRIGTITKLYSNSKADPNAKPNPILNHTLTITVSLANIRWNGKRPVKRWVERWVSYGLQRLWTAASWVKKVGQAESCKVPTKDIMDAENCNVAPKFHQCFQSQILHF